MARSWRDVFEDTFSNFQIVTEVCKTTKELYGYTRRVVDYKASIVNFRAAYTAAVNATLPASQRRPHFGFNEEQREMIESYLDYAQADMDYYGSAY